jgi:hypothetical protein
MLATATVAELALGSIENATQIEPILLVASFTKYTRQVEPLSLSGAFPQAFWQKNFCPCTYNLGTQNIEN